MIEAGFVSSAVEAAAAAAADAMNAALGRGLGRLACTALLRGANRSAADQAVEGQKGGRGL